MKADDYFDLIRMLTPMDRSHNSPEMESAIVTLSEFYNGSKILKTHALKKLSNHWIIPPRYFLYEANVRCDGDIILTHEDHLLAVNTFSHSVDKELNYDEFVDKVLTDANRPDSYLFHFRNQYRHWEEEWGFSIPYKNFEKLPKNAKYQVNIKSDFRDGPGNEMFQCEYVKYGKTKNEFILVGHFDHPGQANDGLCGTVAAFEVIDRLKTTETKYTYRALASVEIVGSAAYLEERNDVCNILEGMFIGFSGNREPLCYQTSYDAVSRLDRITMFLLNLNSKGEKNIFGHRSKIGNDENVFDSVHYEIPMGTLMRYPLPQYHTSDDNLSNTSRDQVEEVIRFLLEIIEIVEKDAKISPAFKGLPCLSNPEIDAYLSFNNVSGFSNGNLQNQPFISKFELAQQTQIFVTENPNSLNRLMQSVLREANRDKSIFDIAEKLSMPFDLVHQYCKYLENKGILILE